MNWEIGNLQNHLVLGENESLGSLSPKDTLTYLLNTQQSILVSLDNV